MNPLLHFSDISRQSVRLDTILHVTTDTRNGVYYVIKLTVDLPAEIDFTGGKKREMRLWYDTDKAAMEADLKMLRMASTAFVVANPEP